MMIYGDTERSEDAGALRDAGLRRLWDARQMPAGVLRHSALVDALIRMSEFAQGIADAEFQMCGFDRPSESQHKIACALVAAAKALDHSWQSKFRSRPDVETATELLSGVHVSGKIRTRACEGYAHYALYPESYLEAARRSGMGQNSLVIGIRSIGAGLGAVVAAGLGAPAPISLRPIGHPFDRRIRADPALVGKATADPSVRFAVVDEGPGLSGSSFAAVWRWLRGQGISTDRISFFPSHGGSPGHAASREIRTIWPTTKKYEASSDDVIACPSGLAAWIDELTGTSVVSLREVSVHCLKGSDAPMPTDERFERRKFLARTTDGLWLAKFAGLGELGERKFRDATLLARAGFIPEVAGIRHGFIIQRWVEGRPLGVHFERSELLRRIAGYLAFRSCHLPGPTEGACLKTLKEMAVRNTYEALGADAAKAMEKSLHGIHRLRGEVRQVRTDNRLHAWEWLCTERGLMKTDALDHCEAHDLVGCQDIAWDIAGAIVEHRLSDVEASDLSKLLEEAGGHRPNRELTNAALHCYLAFQLGLWSTARFPAGPGSARNRCLATFYAAALRRLLLQAPA